MAARNLWTLAKLHRAWSLLETLALVRLTAIYKVIKTEFQVDNLTINTTTPSELRVSSITTKIALLTNLLPVSTFLLIQLTF
jgi:hypothetical protein